MTVLLFRGDTFYCTNHATDALLVVITWYSASNGDVYVLTTILIKK